MVMPPLTDEQMYGPDPWASPPPPANMFQQFVARAQSLVERAQAVQVGPSGRTLDQITGTDYLSDEERQWYLAQRGLAPAGAGVRPLDQPSPQGMELFERGLGAIFGLLPSGQTARAIEQAAAQERMPSMRAASPEDLSSVPSWAREEVARKLRERRQGEAEALSTAFLDPYLARAQQAAPAPSMGQFFDALGLPGTLAGATARELGAPSPVPEISALAADLMFPVLGAPGGIATGARVAGRAARRYAGRAVQAAPLESAAVQATGLPALGPRRVTAGRAPGAGAAEGVAEAPPPRPPVAPPSGAGAYQRMQALGQAHLDKEDLLRSAAERMEGQPVVGNLVRATNPAAIARETPPLRAFLEYKLLDEVQAGERVTRLAALPKAKSLFVIDDKGLVTLANGAKAAFGDVFQAPAKFALTPEQNAWIKQGWAILDDYAGRVDSAVAASKKVGQAARAIRRRTFAEGEHYWPRFVQDKKGRVRVGGGVGRKQGPELPRIFEEMGQGIEAGKRYVSDPDATLSLFVKAMQKREADIGLLRRLNDLGVGELPSLRVPAAIRGRMEKATGEYIAAQRVRRAITVSRPIEGLAPGLRKRATVARQEAQAKLVSAQREYFAAKTAYRRASEIARLPKEGEQLVQPFGARIFTDTEAKILRAQMAPAQPAVRLAAQVNAIPRTMITGMGDVGQMTIQMLGLAYRNPAGWSKAIFRGLENVVTPARFREFLSSPMMARAASHGVDVGGSEFFAGIAPLERIPGVAQLARATQRGFEGMLTAGRGYYFDGLATAAVKKGGEAELDRVGRYVNTMLGTPNIHALGVSATQQAAENAFVFFASRYTRSVPGMVAYMASNGFTGQEARRAMLSLVLGGAATYAGIGLALGRSREEILDGLNPMSGKRFMSFKIGPNWYGVGGAYRSYLKFMGDLAAGARSTVTGDELAYGQQWHSVIRNPLSNFLRSRTSPLTGTLIDILEGEDFIGRDTSLSGFIADPSELGQYGLRRFAPMMVQSYLEAKGGTADKAGSVLAQALGGRGSPETAREGRSDSLNSAIDRYYDAYDYAFDTLKKFALRDGGTWAPMLQDAKDFDDLMKHVNKIAEEENRANPEVNKRVVVSGILDAMGITEVAQDERTKAARDDPALIQYLEDQGVDVPKYMREALEPAGVAR